MHQARREFDGDKSGLRRLPEESFPRIRYLRLGKSRLASRGLNASRPQEQDKRTGRIDYITLRRLAAV
jgi:hypothetical protein